LSSQGPGIQPNKRLIFRQPPLSYDYIDPYAGTRRELIADDFFARPNGPLGPNWSGLKAPSTVSIAVAGRVAVPASLQNNSYGIYIGAAFPADQWSEIKITTAAVGSSGDSGWAAVVRCTPNAATATLAALIIQHDLSQCRIQFRNAGTTYAEWNFRAAWAAGDRARLEVQGQRYSVYRNNKLVFRGVDATGNLSSGQPGLAYSTAASSPVGTIPEWSGGGFGSILTTATDGIPENQRRGPGIQPTARNIFQTTPRDTSSPLAVGTPKDPLEWRSGPGIQPRKRFMFQSTPRDTSVPVGVTLTQITGLSVPLGPISIGEMAGQAAIGGIADVGSLISGQLLGTGVLGGTGLTSAIGTAGLGLAGALGGISISLVDSTGALLGSIAVSGVADVNTLTTGGMLGSLTASGTAVVDLLGLGNLQATGSTSQIEGLAIGHGLSLGAMAGTQQISGVAISLTLDAAQASVLAGINGLALIDSITTGLLTAAGAAPSMRSWVGTSYHVQAVGTQASIFSN
jgi:hypothetical protein